MTIVNTIAHADWRELARRVRDEVGSVAAVISDPPYSDRTHAGQRHGRRPELGGSDDGWVSARGLEYAHWTPYEVASFVEEWSPITSGWICALTDHTLAPHWESEMQRLGRYVFAPIPVVQIGMNVRLAGDGPSSWTCWLVVGRPRKGPCVKWGTLPGAYVGNPFDAGENTATASRKRLVVGGKPRWLMERIVEDYTRPSDLVCDPCAGGGTTLLAAKLLGRRYVGSDIAAEHVEIARERLRDLPTKDKRGTLSLFGGDR